VARQPEDLETFFSALRETGAFAQVTSTSEQIQDDGTLRADVQAIYTPPKLAPPTGRATGAATPESPPPASPAAPRTSGGRP
jgi:hypothetical protein